MAEADVPLQGKGQTRLIGRGMLSPTDAVVLDIRPSLFMIPVRSAAAVMGLCLLLYLAVRCVDKVWSLVANKDGIPEATEWTIMLWGALLIVGFALVYVTTDYLTRRYVLTERRAFSVVGAVDQRIGEIGLDRLESLVISKPPMARLFGMGHIHLASAGTDGFTVQWRYLRSPERIAARIREVQARAAT
jgi:hypothetical protein